MKKNILVILILIHSITLLSQSRINRHSDLKHYHSNELSLGVGIVSSNDADKITPGFHLHYLKSVGEKTSLGGGLEYIADEHKHLTLAPILTYNIYKEFFLSIAPGVVFAQHDNETEIKFSQHFELNYEIDLREFHFGPIVGVGIDSEATHIVFGIHAGKAF